MGKRYATDLSDAEWEILKPLVPKPRSNRKIGGRPIEYERRSIVDAILYLLRTGCAWRLLPNDFPPYQIVYHYFSTWKKDGTWKRIHDRLRGDVRESVGKNRSPSAAIIDSQSVKTTEKGGSAVTTQERRSRVASGMCSSTRLA